MNAIRSQKASTASTSPSAASAGIILSARSLDIGGAIVRELGWQRMGGEQRRANRDRTDFREAAHNAERLSLGLDVKPISGFDFNRRHPLGDEGVEAPQRRADEILLARLARGPNARENASAAAGDLFIGCAREPHLEFPRPIAAVDEVGVAVDQAGGDPATLAIDDARAGATVGGDGVLRAGEDDAAVPRDEGAVIDSSEAGRA